MLAHDLQAILTVEQWGMFKQWVADKPKEFVVTGDQYKYENFNNADVHAFLIEKRILL